MREARTGPTKFGTVVELKKFQRDRHNISGGKAKTGGRRFGYFGRIGESGWSETAVYKRFTPAERAIGHREVENGRNIIRACRTKARHSANEPMVTDEEDVRRNTTAGPREECRSFA